MNKKLFAVVLFAFALTACTGTQIKAGARLALEAKLADVLVQSGDPADTVISADLSEYELNQIIQAIDTYQLVRNRWQATADNPGDLAINILLLQDDYQVLIVQYMLVRSIVQVHWDDYTPGQQFALTSYHNRAVSLGTAFQQFIQASERRQALNTALEIGLLLARVAAV